MELHHLGCLVADIHSTIQHYQTLLGESVQVSRIYDIQAQKVQVCFIEMKDNTWLELVAPADPNSSLGKMLHKKGRNFYHLGFKVADIDAREAALKAQGWYLVNSFYSEAFEGKKCIFLFNPDMHLIELIAQ